ncbi:MAG: hypothetical protein J6A25_13880 [Lachnospiraceae bacterium]|nr:hypothetical protein [Lachnospiraceae bacterium]
MSKIILPLLNNTNIIETKEVTLNENTFLVKTYLPMEEKINLIETVMQNSIEFNFVNPLKVETYFNAFMAIKYTNIDFSEYLEDIANLYDLVNRAGIIQAIVDNANEDYNELWDYCQSFINKYENYQNSLYGVVSQIISDIPEKLGSAMDELARLDMSKLQNVFQEISETGGNSGALMQSVFGKDKNK